jgi:hypothetical protein
MKNLKLLFIITLIGCNGCNTSNFKDKDVVFIEKFYNDYITELSRNDFQNVNADSVLKMYCTPRLISFLKTQYSENELDYDPFLNAQDVDKGIINTLEVRKDKSTYNLYSVSYTWPGAREKVEGVRLIVLNEGERSRIDYVFIAGYPDPKYPDIE